MGMEMVYAIFTLKYNMLEEHKVNGRITDIHSVLGNSSFSIGQ